MFEQLTEPPPEEPTPVFWATPDAKEITDFVWDTGVLEVTKPWPTIEDPAPMSIRDAIQILSRRTDVTDFLYTIKDLEQYAKTYDSYEYPPLCDNCGNDCKDKWCGLRGDEGDTNDDES